MKTASRKGARCWGWSWEELPDWDYYGASPALHWLHAYLQSTFEGLSAMLFGVFIRHSTADHHSAWTCRVASFWHWPSLHENFISQSEQWMQSPTILLDWPRLSVVLGVLQCIILMFLFFAWITAIHCKTCITAVGRLQCKVLRVILSDMALQVFGLLSSCVCNSINCATVCSMNCATVQLQLISNAKQVLQLKNTVAGEGLCTVAGYPCQLLPVPCIHGPVGECWGLLPYTWAKQPKLHSFPTICIIWPHLVQFSTILPIFGLIWSKLADFVRGVHPGRLKFVRVVDIDIDIASSGQVIVDFLKWIFQKNAKSAI